MDEQRRPTNETEQLGGLRFLPKGGRSRDREGGVTKTELLRNACTSKAQLCLFKLCADRLLIWSPKD